MLNKAIEHGKEHRKPYYGAKAIDPTCRNHGSDYWSKENRTFNTIKNQVNLSALQNIELE